MSFDHFLWSSTGSADSPMIFVLRRSNSLFIFAMVPSSVVHTGVKSLGCENSTAHLSPIHWWKSTRPSVVSAWKFGAVSPIRRLMGPPWTGVGILSPGYPCARPGLFAGNRAEERDGNQFGHQ